MHEAVRQFDPVTMPLAGMHSIDASAGTGKTFAITTLYLRYLLEFECSVEEILVTTFTEAATAELKDRLRRRLTETLAVRRTCQSADEAVARAEHAGADPQIVRILSHVKAWDEPNGEQVLDRLEDALLNFDRAPVHTIHGFCAQVLQQLVFETGSRFDVELLPDEEPLIEQAVHDFVSRLWTAPDSRVARWLPLREPLWGTLHDVARAGIAQAGTTIVPDGSDLEALLSSPLLNEFAIAAEKLAEVWRRDRTAIEQLLWAIHEQGWFQQVNHKADQLREGLRFVDDFVDAPSPWAFHCKAGKVEAVERRLGQNALEKGIKGGDKENRAPRHAAFELLDDVIAVAQQVQDRAEQIRARVLSHCVSFARDHVRRYKQDHDLMSYGDLLSQVDDALHGPLGEGLRESLCARFRVALVDEFQDTDLVQFRIFQSSFFDRAKPAGRPSAASRGSAPDVKSLRAFVMIGDPKQSIYRFRGADLHSYLVATAAVPEGQRYQMGTNWRSDRSLVDAVQAIFSSVENPFLNEHIQLARIEARYPDRFTAAPALTLALVSRSDGPKSAELVDAATGLQRLTDCVAADIVCQLNSRLPVPDGTGGFRPVEPRDVAVLCRTSAQLRRVQEALSARRVPAVLYTEESVYATNEAECVSDVLQTVLNPGSFRWIANALRTPLFGLNAAELAELQNDEVRLTQWAERFQNWNDLWQHAGFIVFWRRMLDELEIIPRLAQYVTGERQITNYLHLGELLHQQASTAHAGPDELWRWYQQTRTSTRARDEIAQLRLETDSAAVQLCTIHKSKGLEYSIVYCPTLWTGGRSQQPAFVSSRFDAARATLPGPVLDVGSDLLESRIGWTAEEEAAEDRRLLYVALTRARHHCRIHWIAANGCHRSALGQMLFNSEMKETDDALQQRLQAWVTALAVERVSVERAVPPAIGSQPERMRRSADSVNRLVAASIQRATLPAQIQTSFSALTRFAVHVAHDWADRDATLPSVSGGSGTDRDSLSVDRVPLADMPGGTRVGDIVHRTLERVLGEFRFGSDEPHNLPDVLESVLEEELRRAQFDEQWRKPLAETLTDCLTRRIVGLGVDCSLAEVPHADRACELPFLFRIGRAHPFSAAALAASFEGADHPMVKDYAHRAGQLSASDLQGYLAGVIDLVFRIGGRWFVVDYKTTNLGPRPSDYAPERLATAMRDHDYVLQYHLYCAAVSQFLKQRIPDFDYERDFGGVFYLFLRGILRVEKSLGGVFCDRPSASLIGSIAVTLAGEDLA